MTLRTALIAARRSSGRPCKYSSTVAALLFIKSFCVAEGEPGLEPRQAPSFFLHGRSADRVCDRRITEDRTSSRADIFFMKPRLSPLLQGRQDLLQQMQSFDCELSENSNVGIFKRPRGNNS